MPLLTNLVRSKGDPKVLQSGPSSMGMVDRLARQLGWFSIGLGLVQLFAPGRVTRTLGLEGSEGKMRAFGAREIGSGLACLSVDKHVGLWSRIAGDGLDVAALLPALSHYNPKRGNAKMALAAVCGITVLDVVGAFGASARHSRSSSHRNYGDRSGFPKGLQAARGAARAKLVSAAGSSATRAGVRV